MTRTSQLLDTLASTERSGMKLGLDRFEGMLTDLDHPERAFPCVLVGGTNGKGSVAAMLARTLEASGHRTGLFTSPHLLSYRERVRVDRRAIAPAEIEAVMSRLAPSIERHGGSFFEAMTALAFLHFRRVRVDVAVLEVGLGGRLDSTNLSDPLVSTVVTIGMDHTRVLGRTIDAIAGEKVHISRRGRPFVVGASGRAGAVLDAAARRRGASPVRLGRDARYRTIGADRSGSNIRFEQGGRVLENVRIAMPGRHQARNGAVAITTAVELDGQGLSIPNPAAGLDRVQWPGRLDWVAGSPDILMDGAHNPAGSRALANHLEEFCGERRIVAVAGLLGTRSPRAFVKPLWTLVSDWVMTQPPGERALPVAQMAAAVPGASVEPDVGRAVDKACKLAGPDGLVLVAGSLRVVAAAMRALGRKRLDLI